MAAALTLHRASFIDRSHLQFYSAGNSPAAATPPRPRRTPRLDVAAASHGEGRRARVLQQVADVESTLHSLEQAAPMATAQLVVTRQAAAAAPAPSSSSSLESHRLQRSWSSSSSSAASSQSSDSSSSESSSSESEDERPSAAARLSRRLAQQAQLRRHMEAEASNILAAPVHAPAVAATAAAAPGATVVRVCQGKKCAAAGASALLAHYAAQPGVVAHPTKCLKQCRRCVAVEMAAAAGPARGCAALYTGVNGANAAEVLALHRQAGAPAPAAA